MDAAFGKPFLVGFPVEGLMLELEGRKRSLNW